MPPITRRRVLQAFTALLSPLAPHFAHSARASDLERVQLEAGPTLRQMARLLFPHQAIPETVYDDVVDDLIQASAIDPTMQERLLDAPTVLDRVAQDTWVNLTESWQAQTMRRVEKRPFFDTVRTGVRDRLYAHPDAWPALGYPGSSIEFGGYFDRGYDDIDWLPADEL